MTARKSCRMDVKKVVISFIFVPSFDGLIDEDQKNHTPYKFAKLLDKSI